MLTVGQGPELTPALLAGADALVVAGGDGTVHHAAGAAIESGVPIYHAACGNENLFAREFGMRPDPRAVLDALDHGERRRVDLGQCNGSSFLIMGSVGPDASVIRRLHRSRRRPTGHLAYARPVLYEAFRPYLPEMTVHVDGETLLGDWRGIVVVANCRQYAMRVDPCPGACMDDGLLDLVCLPCTTTVGAARRFLQCRRRVQGRYRGVVFARGERVSLEIKGDDPICQMDGEAPRAGGAVDGAGTLEFMVEAGVLPVLVPPAR